MRLRIVLTLLVLCCLGCVCSGEAGLESGFKLPPADAKPHIWWHWMNGNITREGIKADLEAMAEVGIGGAQIFNVGAENGPVDMPVGPVDYMSDEWLEMVKYAAEQADRLGLELCLHNCAGWTCSGGPWISPDMSMQMLTWSQASVSAAGEVEIQLAQPQTLENYYRDIVVLAFPRPLDDSFRVNNWRAKAGFEDRQFKLLPEQNDVPGGAVIDPDSIIDLSDKMDSAGKLKWNVPEGRWTILRIGHTSTGKTNKPAPKSGRGLECDKLRRAALDLHWEKGIKPVLDKLGPLAGTALNNILIDSYEAGINNWTPGMMDEFKSRNGYSLKNMLPALTGRVVGSGLVTERFLWDYRRTISDMIAENYFDYFVEKCHDAGLLCSIEPYDGPFESTQAGNNADILMSEFWVKHPINHSMKLVASVAHTNGQKYVGAESFTSNPQGGKWQNYPGSLKMLGDMVWCQGVNRYIFHSFAHQPWLDKFPGMTMGQWGTHFNRANTWWKQSKSWMQYIARSQYLLQRGVFAADVLYFIGESVPGRLGNVGTAGGLHFDMGSVSNRELREAGYDYDICGADVLKKLTVKDGLLSLPDGMQYKILVLPESTYIRPELAEKLLDLVNDGATIMAPQLTMAPGLKNYPECDTEVKLAAAMISGSGKGKVIHGENLLKVLGEMDVVPDCIAADQNSQIEYIHRICEDAEIYFVSHQDDSCECNTDIFFRVSGYVPELWNPVTGEIKNAGIWRVVNDRTAVNLDLGPAESVFVIFRKPTQDNLVTVDSLEFVKAEKTGSFICKQNLEILEGRYEVYDADGSDAIDVTDKLKNSVVNGRINLTVNNELFGKDPAPEQYKKLYVKYSLGGKVKEQYVTENCQLHIPVIDLVPVGWQPETTSGLSWIEAVVWDNGEYAINLSDGEKKDFVVSNVPDTVVVDQAWAVDFTPDWGAPSEIELPYLMSWTENDNVGVRYYSGTGVYKTTLKLPVDFVSSSDRIELDLGSVCQLAEVIINGKNLGVLWCEPFRLDVTDAVMAGSNDLEVRVTNLWVNRLIGDEQSPDDYGWTGDHLEQWPEWLVKNKPRPVAERLTFKTWNHWGKYDELKPSGLIGPVYFRGGKCIKFEIE